MAKKAQEGQAELDPNIDRYPGLQAVLAQIPQQEDFPEGPVERLEITCLANGDATCRVWPARAEVPWGTFMDSRLFS